MCGGGGGPPLINDHPLAKDRSNIYFVSHRSNFFMYRTHVPVRGRDGAEVGRFYEGPLSSHSADSSSFTSSVMATTAGCSIRRSEVMA
jgi:hypothetical protein